MKFSKRKTKVLSELIKSDDYLTGEHFATILGVSTRTIRNDVKELNDCFFDVDFQIEGISGKGYRITKNTKEKVLKIVDFDRKYSIPILPESRIDYIIKQLLLNPKGIILSQISEKLYVSESTLYRDMSHVIQWFKDKDIQISKSKGNTFSVNGIEQNIRKAYVEYYSSIDVMNYMPSTSPNEIFDQLIINTRNDFISFLKNENIKLTGDEFNVLVINTVVVIFRSMNGYGLNSFEDRQVRKNSLVLEKINFLNKIETLNDFDKEYIVCIVNKLIFDDKDVQKNKEILEVAKQVLSNISKTFEFSFSKDILNGLCEVLSKSFKVEATEYSLSNIKKEYPLAFEMAMAFANQIIIDLDINLSESKLINIVFLFAINMEFDMYGKENEHRDVAIVCKSNKYNTDLLEIRIKRHFPAFNIIGCYAPYRIDEVIDMNPELIISTSILDTDELPVIVIDPMFKDYDVIKINSFINQIEHKESNTYDFMNLFKEDLFFKDIDANNQYEVINSLFETLKKSGRGNEQFLQAVFDRESISSTYIGNMVAIPHAIGVNIGENVVAIGITKKPINWQNDKVQLIFLINIRNASEGKVKKIFNSFFEVINSRKKVERLIKSKNFYEFIKTISS